MVNRSGSADLPLHGGRVPAWLSQRMAKLGSVICQAIAAEYGRDELLSRLSNPFWFQSFGAVMGMDWHSSGITTSVIGALKRGLQPIERELGLYVCGGRGRHSRKTPEELRTIGERVGFDGDALGRASRLVAKVDSAAVQDGFDLYLHGFIVAADGSWVVVQQGMRDATGTARRYHWKSAGLADFVDAPHAAIEGENFGDIVNLSDHRADRARAAQLELLAELGPDGIVEQVMDLRPKPETPEPAQMLLPHLVMPGHHDIREKDVIMRRLHGALSAAETQAPKDFAELLLVPGIGARTVEAVAQVAEVIHGAPHRFTDPARFAMAHGGKDGAPFPVPVKVYDETIGVLKSAMVKARLGQTEEAEALKRLDRQARSLERTANGPSFREHIDNEWRNSERYGGRTVFDDAAERRKAKAGR